MGLATSPPMIQVAIGARKNMGTRYMPKVSRARREMKLSFPAAPAAPITPATPAAPAPAPTPSAPATLFPIPMQLNIMKSPKVCSRTLGVQNCQDHSISGVGRTTPGTPFHQKDHPVKAAPTRKHKIPTASRFRRSQSTWTRIWCARTRYPR